MKRKEMGRGLCAALLGLGVSACTDAGAMSQRWMPASEQEADLAQLQGWIDLDQSFPAGARAEANERLTRLLDGGGFESEAEFYVAVAGLTALADNGHSNPSTGPVSGRLGLVPIRTYWFSDGPRVVRARSPHRDLLGARLDEIAGAPVEDLVQRLGALHGGTDEHFEQYYSGVFFLSPALLTAAGLADGPRDLEMTFTLADGSRATRTLSSEGPGASPAPGRPWRRLVSDPLPGEDGDWTVLDGGGALLALRDHQELFRYELLSAGGAAYVQLRLNIGSGGASVRAFVADVRERIADDGPTNIVLDNRFNPGGDLTRTAAFALDLPSMIPEGGKVYVLTSNATFSAGIYTSFYPKAAAPDRTVVVGERVGDRERFWAETGSPFTLSNSGYRLNYSLQLHDLGSGCFDEAICHMTRHDPDWNVAVGSLDPDVKIGFDFDDFMAGRDPVLDYALGTSGAS